MEQHDELEFDDAGLKSAVHRAWGAEQVPQRLRGRISHLVATAGSVDDSPGVATPSGFAWDRWSGRIYGLVAAAVIASGLGFLVLFYVGAFDTVGSRGGTAQAPFVPSRTDVPIALAHSMIATHSACGKLHDHRLIDGVVGDSFAALNVKLTSDLGFPAMARPIGTDWTFKGAGECNVGELRGSHLIFTRGDQTVSVFSLPAYCMSGVASGAMYDGLVDNHAVAGFARAGAVSAVVGSSASGSSPAAAMESATSIRDTLFNAFEGAGCADDELLGFVE